MVKHACCVARIQPSVPSGCEDRSKTEAEQLEWKPSVPSELGLKIYD